MLQTITLQESLIVTKLEGINELNRINIDQVLFRLTNFCSFDYEANYNVYMRYVIFMCQPLFY